MADQSPPDQTQASEMRGSRGRLLTHLGHPSWQGVGALAGIIGVLIAVIAFVSSSDDPGKPKRDQTNVTAVPPGGHSQTAVTHSPSNTSPSTPEPALLDGLDQVEGYLVRGERKVNGRVYAHALSREIGSSDMCGDIGAAMAGFDLDRRYDTFAVVVGLSDDAFSDVSARFKVFGDGELLKSATVTLGTPVLLRVPVTGVLRLRIEANTNICQYGDYGEIVWADPTLTPQ